MFITDNKSHLLTCCQIADCLGFRMVYSAKKAVMKFDRSLLTIKPRRSRLQTQKSHYPVLGSRQGIKRFKFEVFISLIFV